MAGTQQGPGAPNNPDRRSLRTVGKFSADQLGPGGATGATACVIEAMGLDPKKVRQLGLSADGSRQGFQIEDSKGAIIKGSSGPNDVRITEVDPTGINGITHRVGLENGVTSVGVTVAQGLDRNEPDMGNAGVVGGGKAVKNSQGKPELNSNAATLAEAADTRIKAKQCFKPGQP